MTASIRQRRRAFNGERGISLIEMLVTIVLLAVVTRTAMGNISDMLVSFNRGTARREFDFDLRRARAEATAEGTRTIVAINADGDGYSVGFDYIPYSSPAVIETQLFTRNLPSNITVAADQTIIFDSRGYLVDEAGDLTQTTFEMNEYADGFLDAIIYPTGMVEYD